MRCRAANVVIALEGNIGSGKTDLLQKIERELSLKVVFEPADQWQMIDGTFNMLAQFYADRSRWAYSFQTYSFVTRVNSFLHHIENQYHGVVVTERSVFSDRYCFAQASMLRGDMSELEWKLYLQWFEWLIKHYAIVPYGFIYLQSQPESCLETIVRSGRPEECAVDISYLRLLHDCHEHWLTNASYGQYKRTLSPVLTVSPELLQCPRRYKNEMERIRLFITKDCLGVQALEDRLTSSCKDTCF